LKLSRNAADHADASADDADHDAADADASDAAADADASDAAADHDADHAADADDADADADADHADADAEPHRDRDRDLGRLTTPGRASAVSRRGRRSHYAGP
jgi:hypothetical protein